MLKSPLISKLILGNLIPPASLGFIFFIHATTQPLYLVPILLETLIVNLVLAWVWHYRNLYEVFKQTHSSHEEVVAAFKRTTKGNEFWKWAWSVLLIITAIIGSELIASSIIGALLIFLIHCAIFSYFISRGIVSHYQFKNKDRDQTGRK